MADVCHILFCRSEFNDITGCLKPSAHNDHHVCRTSDGRLMAWEDDYECNCGCWDDEEYDSVCRVYWEVKEIK